jgi:hypothetical protein
MASKKIIGGMGTLLGETKPVETKKKNGPGRPKTNTREITKSSQEGTKEGETRATFIINETVLEKIKDLAYWERVTIKEVVNTALQEAILKYEKKNGDIKTTPKK